MLCRGYENTKLSVKVFCQSNDRVYTLLLKKVENIEVKNNTAESQDVRKGTLIKDGTRIDQHCRKF